MKAPLCIELFCGCFGWSRGWLELGGRVVGFDIEHLPHHGPVPDGASLVLQDVLTLHGSQFRDADLLLCSPPCQKYSWLAMPWSRSKDPNNSKAAKALRAKWETEGPDNRLFEACFRIQREASEAKGEYIPMILENVRGAVPWVGAAFTGLQKWFDQSREDRIRSGRPSAQFGSYFLWGDIAHVGGRIINPRDIRFGANSVAPQRAIKGHGSTWFGVQNNGDTYDQREVNPVSGTKQPGNCSERRWADRPIPRFNNGLKGAGGGSWFGTNRADPRDVRKVSSLPIQITEQEAGLEEKEEPG